MSHLILLLLFKLSVLSMISSFQKLFDNGMICSSEQAAIVDAAIYDEVKAEFEAHQCVIISFIADFGKVE